MDLIHLDLNENYFGPSDAERLNTNANQIIDVIVFQLMITHEIDDAEFGEIDLDGTGVWAFVYALILLSPFNAMKSALQALFGRRQ